MVLASSLDMKPEKTEPQSAKMVARKQQAGRAVAEPSKPDEAEVENAEEAEAHVASQEQGQDAASDDARHGFSQDSGYAQSGGSKSEPRDPKRTQQ